MLRSLLLLVVALLAVSPAEPVRASVTGTLHINAGSSHSSIGLVPDKVVVFDASTEPQMLSFQQDFPNGADPPIVTFARSANAQMDGSDGELSGYIDAELDGIPPSSSSQLGIYAEAMLAGGDYFTLDSDVLDPGDEMEVTFRIAVEGNGPVSSQLHVYHIIQGGGGAYTTVLNLSYDTAQTTGSFTGVVGELYDVEYYLQVYGHLTTFGMSDANSTKFVVSDYRAHVYADTTEPGVVSLGTNSGHDYSQPVPEPSAELLGASAVLALVWGARQRERRTRV